MKKKTIVKIPHNLDLASLDSGTERKSLLVDRYVVTKIEKNVTFVSEYLLEVIERITNNINKDTSLGVIVNGRGRDRFFEMWFDIVNPWEIYLYDIEEVSSDRYLDLMLGERIIATHSRKIRRIF